MSLRRNALLLAVLTALLAIIGEWSGEAALSGLWRMPLTLLLGGLAWEASLTMRAGLELHIGTRNAHSVLGRATPLQLAVRHALARDLQIELALDPPASVEIDPRVYTLDVPASGTASLDVPATPRALGHHAWPEPRARLAGVLGLAWWTRALTTRFTLQVVPDLLHGAADGAGMAGAGPRSGATPGAGAQILQLRDYRPGDPQHMIDWKATARSNRLISREHAQDQHIEIVLAIDAGRASALRAGELDRLGHYANIAARFAEHALAQDDTVGLLVFADRPLAAIAPARGSASVSRIRAALAAMAPVAAESNPLNAALRIRSLVRHRSLVLMLTDLDDASVAGLLAGAARLLLPKHLPLIAGLASPETEALAHAPAHRWLDPWESLAAQEYCSRLERNAAALRALGAPTVLTRPAQMERAVFDAYARFRRQRRI